MDEDHKRQGELQLVAWLLILPALIVLIMGVSYVYNERSARYVVTPSRSATGPAFVKIVSITPASGSAVEFNTLIRADLAYQIQAIDPGAAYFLTPRFQTADDTINLNPGDDRIITEQVGTVTLYLTIERELADPRVVKPIKLAFILRQTKGVVILPIANSEPVVYEVK